MPTLYQGGAGRQAHVVFCLQQGRPQGVVAIDPEGLGVLAMHQRVSGAASLGTLSSDTVSGFSDPPKMHRGLVTIDPEDLGGVVAMDPEGVQGLVAIDPEGARLCVASSFSLFNTRYPFDARATPND
eukprot:362837-Chlamydomonas_euryale.AAC.10